MKKWRCIAYAVKIGLITSTLLAALGTIQITARNGLPKSSAYPSQAYSGPAFRYAIIYNDPALNGLGRDIHILMEPSEFSEQNLRALYGLLCRRYRDQPGFTAFIETSLQDVDTPEEHEGPGFSELPGNPKGGKTPAATIRHSPEADSLYIFLPSRATEHPKKIDLRAPPAGG